MSIHKAGVKVRIYICCNTQHEVFTNVKLSHHKLLVKFSCLFIKRTSKRAIQNKSILINKWPGVYYGISPTWSVSPGPGCHSSGVLTLSSRCWSYQSTDTDAPNKGTVVGLYILATNLYIFKNKQS